MGREQVVNGKEEEMEKKDIPEPKSYPTHPSISSNPDEISVPYLS